MTSKTIDFKPRVIRTTPIGVLEEHVLDRDSYTIWEMVEEFDIPVNVSPIIAIVDDMPVMRKDWDILIEGRDVTFINVPQGKIFSQILQVLASIALTIVAGPLAGIIGGALGITSQIGLALIQAGIVIAGSFLIQALFKPDSPDQGPTQSPTYTLNSQGNFIRLFQPIPKVYGRTNIWMDFAAQPWAEFIGNYQYLNQLFVAGLGSVEVEAIRIEDTEIWNEVDGYNDSFEGVEIEIVPPDNVVTLFAAEVVTSDEVSSLDLSMWGEDNVTYTTPKTLSTQDTFVFAKPGDKIIIKTGLYPGIYTIVDIPDDRRSLTVTPNLGSGEAVATGYVYQTSNAIELHIDSAWVGPFVINPSSTIINKVQFDIIAPRGLYSVDKKGRYITAVVSFTCQIRKVDSIGEPLGDWITVIDETKETSITNAQRWSFSADITDGRYEARVRRVDPESHQNNIIHTIQWGSVRGFIPDDNIFPYVTLIAVRMRATGQLSQQASRRFNAIVRNKTLQYNGTSYIGPSYNKSIAWAVYDVLTDSVYGAGVSNTFIDMDTLYALHQIWESRGDYFNGIFDSTVSVWDALVSILRVGRAIPVLIGGKISFRRFQVQALPRGVFNTSNIVRNSFQTEHMLVTTDTPDDIIIEFTDERTWKLNEVQCTPEDSLSEKPERINLFGITDRTQAWREGIFLAEYNKRARLAAQFTTELEGRLLVRGDTVIVAHDLYDWGEQGTITNYNDTTKTLTLDKEVSIEANSYILLRNRKGQGWGPIKVNPTSQADQVQLDSVDLALVESSQGSISSVWDDNATPFVICASTTEFKRFTIVSGSPRGENLTDLVCMIDDPAVHTVDQGTPPSEEYPYGISSDNRPSISSITVVQQGGSPASAPILNISWTAADKLVDYYVVQISYDNALWETIYTSSGLSTSYTIFPGDIWVRVAGFSTIIGKWTSFSGSFGTASTLPMDPTGIVVTYQYLGASATITWNNTVRATTYTVQLYVESVPGSSTYDDKVYEVEIPNEYVFISSQDLEDLGGPWLSFQVRITANNSTGSSNTVTETVTADDDVVVSGIGLLEPYTGGDAQIQWSGYPGFTSHTVEIVVSSTVVRSTTVNGYYYLYSSAANIANGGPLETFTVRITPKSSTVTGDPTDYVVNAVPGSLTGISTAINGSDELEVDYTTANTPFITHVDVYVNQTGTFDVGDLIESNAAVSNNAYSGVVIGDSGTLVTGDNYVWFRARNGSYEGYLQGPVTVNKP